MSEVNDEFEKLKERAEEALLKYHKEEFEGFVLTCEHRFGALNEDPICSYQGSNLVDCCFSTSPRINPPTMWLLLIQRKMVGGEK